MLLEHGVKASVASVTGDACRGVRIKMSGLAYMANHLFQGRECCIVLGRPLESLILLEEVTKGGAQVSHVGDKFI